MADRGNNIPPLARQLEDNRDLLDRLIAYLLQGDQRGRLKAALGSHLETKGGRYPDGYEAWLDAQRDT